MGKQKLPGEFLERVQRLEFPEFSFLPADGAAVKEDSLVPLYRMTHAFEGHLDVRQWKLSDDLLRVLAGQITFWLASVYGGEYNAAREMLLHPEKA